MTRITVDEEFGAEHWWNAARDASNRPAQLDPIFNDYEQEIILEDGEAEAIEQWCATIPGWNEGTEFASHPLLFNPADDD